VPDGTSCDDDSACTSGEECTGGVCGGGTTVVCQACESCDPDNGGCIAAPRPVCSESVVPLKSLLLIKDKTPDTADLVVWKWLKGADTLLSAFGDPLSTEDYTLCVYDGNNEVVLRAEAPAGGTCGTVPCWKSLGAKGFKYKDRETTPTGMLKLLLKAGTGGTAKVVAKAKGDNIVMPDLPLTLPVVAQLQSSGGACFGTEHVTAGTLLNDDAQFKAKDGQ